MKESSLRYAIFWTTCRNTPFLARQDVIKSLSAYFENVYQKFGEVEIESWDTPDPHTLEVTVSTSDTHRAPSSIFWAISRDSAAYLLKSFPELSRLPSIWTLKFSVRTKGKA